MAKTTIILNIDNQVEGADRIHNLSLDYKELTRVSKEAQQSASGFSQSFRDVAMACASVDVVIRGLDSAVGSLAQQYASFDSSMRAVNTMAGLNGQDLEELTDKVRELSKEVPIAREALANGLYQVISNGVPEDNWITFLEASARSAVGGMADLGGVVTVTSTILKNYGLAWSEAGAIQDKIQLTAKNGVTSFEQLQQALPRVAANAATLGVSIDELMASFATLTGVSGNTAEVSTQLAAIFTSLVKPSSQAVKMAEEMGIKFDAAAIKAAGGFRNFVADLDASVQAYSQRSGKLAQEIYGKLFGSAEALRALIPITGQLSDKYVANVEAMAASAGVMDEAFAEMSGTAEAQETRLRNNIAAMTDWIGAVAQGIRPYLSYATAVGQSITGIVTLTKAVSAATKGIATHTVVTKVASAASAGWSSLTTKLSRAHYVLTWQLRSGTAATVAMTAATVALAAAITGGLYLAVTAVTAALSSKTAAEERSARATDGLKEADEAYVRANVEAQKAMGAEMAKLKSLIDSHADTTEAVNRLNREYKDAFGTHKTAAEWYDTLRNKSADYAKQLALEAKATALRDRIAQASVEAELARERMRRLEEEGKARETHMVMGATSGSIAGGQAVALEVDTEPYRQAKETIAQCTANTEVWQQELNDVIKVGEGVASTMAGIGTEIEKVSETTDKTTDKGKKSVEGVTSAYRTALNTLQDYNDAIDYMQRLQLTANQQEYRALEEQIRKLKEMRDLFRGIAKDKGNIADDADNDVADWFASVRKQTQPLVQDITDSGNAMRLAEATSKEAALSMWGGIKGVGSGVEQLSDALQGHGNTWQQVTGIIDGTLGVYQSMAQIVSLITALTKAMGLAKKQEVATDTAATGIEVANSGARTAAATVEANADVTGATAKVMKAHASIPWVGIAIGAGLVATMLAVMKGLPKFADGGIAYGPTLGVFGEYPNAANNPEVVAPLDRLRSIMGTSDGNGGRVEFEIRGDRLWGVLKRYERKLQKT